MSASTEKKVRQALRDAGTDKRAQAAQEEAKKKAASKVKWTLTGVGIAILVVLVLVLNSSMLYTKTTAVEINGKSYTPSQVNYNYATQYQNFVSNYGSYASLFGLDTSRGIAGLSNQECYMTENGGTWRDYFLDQALSSMGQTDALVAYAKENGIELDAEEIQEVKDSYADLEETAVSYGYKNADGLIAANYGVGNNVETATENSLKLALASKAYAQVAEETDAATTDEEVKEAYPTVAVRHILVKAVADEEGVYTDEAKETAKTKAEAILAVFEGTATAEQMNLLGIENVEEAMEAEKTASEVADGMNVLNELKEKAEGVIDEAAAEADDEAVTEGAEEIKGILNAASDKLTDLVGQGLAEENIPAYGTEEYFAELANTYSEDDGSNTSGGLYDSVMQGQMVEEFDAWCFDESRNSGDTGIVYGESSSYAGYHVMYFVGEGDPANNTTGRNYVVNEKMNEWLNNLTSDTSITYKFFYRLAGKLG